jgi:hypothetical protein
VLYDVRASSIWQQEAMQFKPASVSRWRISVAKTAKQQSVSATPPSVQVSIPAMQIGQFEITLIGDSSLVCHKWSDKAKKQMLGKQMKEAKQAREAKDPVQDYKDSLYEYPGGGYGFPTIAFKAAAVDACSHAGDITKVLARGAFHIDGDLVKINGKPQMREDMVRVGMGQADIRYRGEFIEWSATFSIRYNRSVLSPEQIVNLFNIAGFAIGVGEHRPQKDGSWGMFHVKTS